MSIKSKRFLVGVFKDDSELVHAMVDLRESNFSIYDTYTPFPLHGIDDLLEIKRTRLPIISFVSGITGCLLAFGFQIWSSAIDWPVNVGGKPFNSFPAFVPVAFEIAVLFGALITVAAFLFRSKLFPKDIFYLANDFQTDHKFVLAIEEKNAGLDIDKITQILEKNQVEEIHFNEGAQWCRKL